MILVTDTWLHVATSTISYSRATPSDMASHYGRQLGSWYRDENDIGTVVFTNTCNVGSNVPILSVADEAYLVLNNLSSVHQVSTFEKEGQLYALLTNSSMPLDIDFETSSFATATKCRLSNHNCDLRNLKRKETRGAGDDMRLPFSCSSEFHGDLTNLSFLNCSSGSSAVGLRLFEHANLTNSLYRCDDDNHGIFTPPSGNSLYFGTWATVQYATLDGTGYSSYDPEYSYDPDNLAHESEIVHPYISVDSWILACSTTAYRVDYQWVNGGVGAATVQEDYSLGLLVGYQWTDACSQPDLANITRTMSHSRDKKDLEDQWALGFSKTTIARLAHLTTPTSTTAEQHRSKFLVARIPKAPLFVLVILNLIYAQVAIWLACYVCLLAHPSQTRNVQARLTITGWLRHALRKAPNRTEKRSRRSRTCTPRKRTQMVHMRRWG
jgi:hypothetical protein